MLRDDETVTLRLVQGQVLKEEKMKDAPLRGVRSSPIVTMIYTTQKFIRCRGSRYGLT